jgi:hypothetical protein
LAPEGEQAWLRLKKHIEWADGFLVGFIFSDHFQVVNIFRERLADIFRARVTHLQFFLPEKPDNLPEEILNRLLNLYIHETEHGGPLWIDLSEKNEDSWKTARMNLIARLNENREALRKKFGKPLVIIFPLKEKDELRSIAPDLWVIRSFSIETDGGFITHNVEDATRADYVETPVNIQLTTSQQSIINEWHRLKENGIDDRRLLDPGFRAFNVYFALKQIVKAKEISDCLLLIAQKNSKNNTPESMRDLSVSLDNVGRTAASAGDFEKAKQAYSEGLNIGKKLALAFPQIPRYSEFPDYFSERIKTLHNKKEQE